MSDQMLRIGLAGAGVVGQGLLNILQKRPYFAPTHVKMVVTSIAVRDPNRQRLYDISQIRRFSDPVSLALSSENDVFVELIGGAEGPAREAVEAALNIGKPVVTANKALLAIHGKSLAALAESKGTSLLFEAAVMGGTPAVKMLREGLVGDQIDEVAGILNGTCNYILSEMETAGKGFAEVLAEAQAKGFAEADPKADIGGYDAGHKIALLGALAFGSAPQFSDVAIEGIEGVELMDIRFAHDLGYRIKLIAEAKRFHEQVALRVHPALLPLSHPLSQVAGAMNALFIQGQEIGRILLQGQGAGAGPTAAAVAADLSDLTTKSQRPVFQKRADQLFSLPSLSGAERKTAAFIRLMVSDRPGVMASITHALAELGISIDSVLQRPVHHNTGLVPIILTTQEALETDIIAAIDHMAKLDSVAQRPHFLRIANI